MNLKIIIQQIELGLDNELCECKENSEYWSEEDEKEITNRFLKDIQDHCQDLKEF